MLLRPKSLRQRARPRWRSPPAHSVSMRRGRESRALFRSLPSEVPPPVRQQARRRKAVGGRSRVGRPASRRAGGFRRRSGTSRRPSSAGSATGPNSGSRCGRASAPARDGREREAVVAPGIASGDFDMWRPIVIFRRDSDTLRNGGPVKSSVGGMRPWRDAVRRPFRRRSRRGRRSLDDRDGGLPFRELQFVDSLVADRGRDDDATDSELARGRCRRPLDDFRDGSLSGSRPADGPKTAAVPAPLRRGDATAARR